MKKTAAINVMLEPDVKKKLVEKAKALNLTLTSYIEKVALEPNIFIDENIKSMLKALNLSSN